MKLLIVDDSRAMRTIVRRTLRQAGYQGLAVTEAENGVQAYHAIMESEPDLILSDWNMPEMNGYELLCALRNQGCEVPFGFVTSERTDEMWRRAREAGAIFLVTKPFSVESFRAALEPVMEYLHHQMG